MNYKVERLAETVKSQQDKIESLAERMIRLETVLEMALAGKASSARPIEHKK
jgi:hypothetical protein